MTREIINVQIGNVANHVGAHWWNIQESSFIFDANEARADPTRLNHDIMFREGRDINMKPHYTPRLIVIDAKDNVGQTCMLRYLDHSFNEKIAPEEESTLWTGVTSRVNQSSGESNEFLKDLEHACTSEKPQKMKTDKIYDLDEHVARWTDFLRVPYHPRSVFTVTNFADGLTDFDQSLALTQNAYFRDQIEDRFRFYAEDCDSLQGFHLLTDIHDGFSGITANVLEYIREEFQRSAIFCCPVISDKIFLQEKFDKSQFFANCSRSICELEAECDLILPLSLVKSWRKPPIDFRMFDHLRYKNALFYHTTAIMASVLECISTRWRLYDSSTTPNLHTTCALLNQNNRKISYLSTLLPFAFDQKETNFRLISPNVEQKPDYFDQYKKSIAVLRGMKNLYAADQKRSVTDRLVEAHEKIIDSILPLDRNVELHVVNEPIHTKTPFPHIFTEDIDQMGKISTVKRTHDSGVTSLPVLCRLETSSRSSPFLNTLLNEAKSLEKRHHGDSSVCDIVERLNSIKENY